VSPFSVLPPPSAVFFPRMPAVDSRNWHSLDGFDVRHTCPASLCAVHLRGRAPYTVHARACQQHRAFSSAFDCSVTMSSSILEPAELACSQKISLRADAKNLTACRSTSTSTVLAVLPGIRTRAARGSHQGVRTFVLPPAPPQQVRAARSARAAVRLGCRMMPTGCSPHAGSGGGCLE
jgi:hypothetical protein